MTIRLIRFSEGGQVDPTFREGGAQPVNYWYSDIVRVGNKVQQIKLGDFAQTYAQRLMIDASGCLYVAGQGKSAPGLLIPALGPQLGPDLLAVARFRPDGAQDRNFFHSGINLTPDRQQEAIRMDSVEASGIALDDTGRIVIGGEAGLQADTTERRRRAAVGRFLPSGFVDTDFSGGVVTSPWDAQGPDRGYALAVGPGGRIVLAGTTNSQFSRILILRFRNDGRRDTTFGDNGRVVETSNWRMKATGVTIDHFGRILLSVVSSESGRGWVLMRYRPDGDKDTGFGFGGQVRIEAPADLGARVNVSIDSMDRIVCVGTGALATSGQDRIVLAVFRHLSNGLRDSTFGTNGRQIVGFPQSVTSSSMTLDRKQRIVMAGLVASPDNQNLCQIGLVRLRVDGSIDTSFGNAGRLLTSFATPFVRNVSVVTDHQSRPVVASTSFD